MEDYMGCAFAELHWSPEQFWNSTLRELCAGYARLLPPPEINTFATDTPFFTADEQNVLKEIRENIDRDRNLANGK